MLFSVGGNVMGFFGLLKKGFETMRETNSAYKSLRIQYESYSDERLKDILKSSFSSTLEKTAAHKVLKERGYDKPFR